MTDTAPDPDVLIDDGDSRCPARPGMFSPTAPKLQVAWDATSLSALFKCPRYYELTVLEGWRKSSVHLDFGGFLADGFETYQKARLQGLDKETSILAGLRRVLCDTWNGPEEDPWGGYWEEQWKCDGSVSYKNAKGNKAKCPYAHKRMWFPPPAPDTCGECGGGIVHSLNYCPDHPTKHRINLARALVWYGLDQPDDLEDGLHPILFPDGTPAVELSWRVPVPRTSPHGDAYLLCGHFDYLGGFGHEVGIVDNKTTKKTLGGAYFGGFSPSMQLDTYDMVAPLLFPEMDFSWVCIDALQIMVDTVRTGRTFYRKSHELRVEHYATVMEGIDRAEKYAAQDYWPMDKTSCAMCEFKKVCSAPPDERLDMLAKTFKTQFWNPMEAR